MLGEKIIKLWLPNISLLLAEQFLIIPEEFREKAPNKMSGRRFLYKLNHNIFNDLPSKINFSRVTIAALNKYLKDVTGVLHAHINVCSGT